MGVDLTRTIPIVGSGRPHLVALLVIATITSAVTAPAATAGSISASSSLGTCRAVSATLARASRDLSMPSESDAPFTPFRWERQARRPLTNARMSALTGHAPDTRIEVVDLAYFFRNVAFVRPWHDPRQARDVTRFQRLMKVIRRLLGDVRVYRIGTIRIDAYIIGTCGADLVGLSTVLIET
ncbi:MAG: nuclease A inhibitor family protein [Acidimicrobiales bacterium]